MSNGKGGDGGKGACFKCGKFGHFAGECPEQRQSKGKGAQEGCFNCGKPGHFSRECPQQRKGKGGGGGGDCPEPQQSKGKGGGGGDCLEPQLGKGKGGGGRGDGFSGSKDAPAFFRPAESWQGASPGQVFKLGHLGLGYYLDNVAAEADSQLGEVRPQLPVKWRDCESLRQEKLEVDAKTGAGISLQSTDFGFEVLAIEEEPGQQLQKGDVIVAIEARLLAGLSAPQMQASFQKRRMKGARLQVADLEEVKEMSTRDPAIVDCWDPRHKRVYYFHKQTGKSGWTREELQADAKEAAESKEKASKPPIDLATFMSHGFAAPKEPPKKKKKKVEAANPDAGKDESDLARDEKKRWNDWNEGGQGGYTEQFFEKYKNCQSNPEKPKKDKRLEGSVGPGQGMEYMAKWTGSKNSFN